MVCSYSSTTHGYGSCSHVVIMIPIFGPESYSCFCVSELLAEGTQRPPAKVFLRAARDIEPLEELTQFYCDSAMD